MRTRSFGGKRSRAWRNRIVGVFMPTLPQQIAEKFLAKLSESADIDAEMIGQLRSLLAAKGKLKTDDLLKVFSPPPGRNLA